MKRYNPLFNESKEWLISVVPTSNNTFIAYDPIRQERIYKKGTIQAIHWDSVEEAQTEASKILQKRYPHDKFTFED